MQAKVDHNPLAILLLGPTGSGKTALSLALAERFNGEIISCDSVAVYRGMDCGTAKPSHEERARVPHHLIDVAEPDQPFTAGEYSRQARTAMREIAGRGKLSIVARTCVIEFAKPPIASVLCGFTNCSRALIPHPPRAYMRTTLPSSFAPSRSASPHTSPCPGSSLAIR